MLFLRQCLVLLVLSLLGAGITAMIVTRPPVIGENEIGVVEAKRMANVLWIDARSEEEFLRGHITGAVNLNEDNWPQAIAPMLAQWEPGQTVIVYCGSVSCAASHAVAARLRGAEYQLGNVLVLHGGWESWRIGVVNDTDTMKGTR